MKLIPTKNPEQCHKIICEIKNSWFLLMIVITNSITMVAPLNAGSCQAVSKHVVALCPRFLFSLRSKRKLRHCGNNMFGNSLTRASISLSNHCALISYDNHRKSAFFDVTTYYYKFPKISSLFVFIVLVFKWIFVWIMQSCFLFTVLKNILLNIR